jgi:hypothetical protein
VKLLDHFKAMQAMATVFIMPEPYTDREGKVHTDDDARDSAFAADMIYMLDGPEQRAAERDYADDQDRMEDMRMQVREAQDKVAVANSDRGRATQALGEERKIQNELRTLLFNSEMRYAKLVGYVEGRKDAEPPRMVPEQREGFMAQMSDASGVTMGWRNDASHWFHRS